MTSPYVTKDTRYFDTGYFDMSFPTLISPATRPRRICATSLRMAQLAETRGDEEKADARGPGGYEHPWSHNTTTTLHKYQTKLH